MMVRLATVLGGRGYRHEPAAPLIGRGRGRSFRVLRESWYNRGPTQVRFPGANPVPTTRTTRSITAGTALAPAPREALGVERRAREALSGLEDEAMIEVRISAKAATKALVPVGLLRRYLEAQEVDGRELLVFDSDEEVSSEVAASMLGVSRPHLNELLDIESIPYRRVGNQRRIRVADIRRFRERRERAEAGLRQMAEVTNESADGWNR
jgi:excisionase family DNA binding protein